MKTEELKKRIDALTPEAKGWLHRACNQLADAGEYIDNTKAHAECEAAGLLETDDDNTIETADGVMGIVYSDNYLAAYSLA